MRFSKPEEQSSHISHIWGFFANDFNFRDYVGMIGSTPDDYGYLTPEDLLNWYKRNNSDTLAWNMYKLQNGCTTFPSKVTIPLDVPKMIHLSADFYRRYCELCKKEGIYIVAYTCGGDDYYAYGQHPEWFEEYGPAFACLNAEPYWDRELAIIREALSISPCNGLFVDMVWFSGNCRCSFCQTAYRKFYGDEMPDKYNVRRFRLDTFQRWLERVIKAGRDIVPDLEICINHQWHKDGIPHELIGQTDWYFLEYGFTEWVGEVLRAWGGDKHMFIQCGDTTQEAGKMPPARVAHLLSRRIALVAAGTHLDYLSGECPADNDNRIQPIKRTLGEIKLMQPYLTGAAAIPHATVLYSSSVGNDRDEAEYTNLVGAWVRDATQMNLSCCNVEILERLTVSSLARYEVVFAPEVGWIDETMLESLYQWVGIGGVLFTNSTFGHFDQSGNTLPNFVDHDLLGIRKAAYLSVVSGIFSANPKIADVTAIDDPIIFTGGYYCQPTTAEPVAYGIWADNQVMPLLWQNRLGKGVVFYLACNRLEMAAGKDPTPLRDILKQLLFPHIHRSPFQTTLEYPAEVWLNEQPDMNRLLLHIIAYDQPYFNQVISIRDDLIAGGTLDLVYPVENVVSIIGKHQSGYYHFVITKVYEHQIFLLHSGNSHNTFNT